MVRHKESANPANETAGGGGSNFRGESRGAEFTTTSGIRIKEVYNPQDLAGLNYEGEVGLPGRFPFTRGIRPTMYRKRLWTMRQYAGFGTAEESNRRYRYLLEQGQMGLSVAFDLPTQMGRDSDHPAARGEVGRVGVAIDSLADMETLLAGIPLDRVTTSMTINATAPILLAFYLTVAEKQGIPWDRVGGTVQNDLLKEYVARGTYIYPPGPSLRLTTDLIAFCSRRVPRWNPLSISGYHIREAGSTAVQEVAFTLANGIAYVEAALASGLMIDEFAPRLSFFFNVHNNFFEEVAKFRAARRMWAKIVKERFGAREERSMMLRFHAQTAGSALTAQQPDNNVVRVSLQALAAVLGGAQSLHTNSRDEALALPSTESARLALRTQQIIAYESGVADTVDPLGGSFFVESLTREIEEAAEQYISKIDKMGGAVKAIEAGFMQREIQNAAYRYQQEIERKDRIVVGVNEFQLDDEPESGRLLRLDEQVESRQRERLDHIRRRRDQGAVARQLERVEETARSQENLMPAILEAAKLYATVGEISEALRRVFGSHEPQVVL